MQSHKWTGITLLLRLCQICRASNLVHMIVLDKRWPAIYSTSRKEEEEEEESTIASYGLLFFSSHLAVLTNNFDVQEPLWVEAASLEVVRKTWPCPPSLSRMKVIIIIIINKKSLSWNADNPLWNSKNWNFGFLLTPFLLRSTASSVTIRSYYN